MDEDPPEPKPDQPRFLLPDGCKDLIDVLRRAEPRPFTPLARVGPNIPSESLRHVIDLMKPASVALPDAITVEDLATALNLQFVILLLLLLELMELKILPADRLTAKTELDFVTASIVCAYIGVAVSKLNPPP